MLDAVRRVQVALPGCAPSRSSSRSNASASSPGSTSTPPCRLDVDRADILGSPEAVRIVNGVLEAPLR